MLFFSKKEISERLSLYKTNPETGAYIIELDLDDYSELFNGWDASPLKRKEIEPELMSYFEQAAIEIPLREAIEISFLLPIGKQDSDKDARSISAILNNFKVQLLFTEKQIRDINRRFATYVLFSVIILTFAYTLPERFELSLMFKIMIEGMFIGGWWILWESLNLVFFSGHDIRMRRRFFRRYLKSIIYFKESAA